jgi:ABC-2 type transport system permease protein
VSSFLAAFWAEGLKARRSRVIAASAAAFLLLPVVDGFFMIILKDPERARALGLIGVKAQLVAGVADWPTFLQILMQGTAVAGAMLFAFVSTWVFGREFSDHTAKELLAIPTRRAAIVAAKLLLTALWAMGLTLVMFLFGLGIGKAVDIPGWSSGLARTSFAGVLLTAVLTCLLMPLVALFASMGRGYLLPLAWALGTVVLAQIAAVLGWGGYFPWSVPALVSGVLGPPAEQVGLHSYLSVLLAFAAGTLGTFIWWRSADQSR